MAEEPWKSEDWFSSPWNYLTEVREGFAFPEQIQIHDVTLRDGEQQAGVEFTADDKLRIADALSETGIHRIEAGLPAVSRADREAVTRIAAAGFETEVYAFSRCMVSDVQMAIDCGVTGVVMEVPASHHLIEKAYRWPVEKAIEASVESTRFAHENGLDVTFFPIDATRATMTQLLDDLETVATEGHVDKIALVDTFGVTSPHAIGYYTRRVRERMNVPLETHFHMDFGMGVANTILAAAEGASVLHTTVSGLGERAGNAPTEETVLALLTMYGIDMGIDTRRFYDIAHLVADLSGIPARQPPGDRRPALQRRVGNHRYLGQERRRHRPAGAVPLPTGSGGPAGPGHRDGQGVRSGFGGDVARPQRHHRCRHRRDRGDPGGGQGAVAGEEEAVGQRRVHEDRLPGDPRQGPLRTSKGARGCGKLSVC